MKHLVAIQPDDYANPAMPDKRDASSPSWAAALERAGCEVRWVDVYRSDILAQVQGCDGFMWRWAHMGGMHRVAHRLLPVIERELGIAIYPDQDTCWHYDDKAAQYYLLQGLGIPMPRTWLFWRYEEALEFARGAQYPLVVKLSGGAASSNVRLVRSYSDATRLLWCLFFHGLTTLEHWPAEQGSWPWNCERVLGAIRVLLRGRPPLCDRRRELDCELPGRYAIFQEYLADNPFDIRVFVIGDRAYAFRRINRPNDFRASGSGKMDRDPAGISEQALRLAFLVACRLRCQSVAMDILRRGDELVVTEVSYTTMSWPFHECPGHWRMNGTDPNGELEWIPGQVWPEEFEIADFLERLEARAASARPSSSVVHTLVSTAVA